MNQYIKPESECFGCGACIAACPKGAIAKKETVFGTWMPEINTDLCVHCGLCQNICKKSISQHDFSKRAYIAYNANQAMRVNSASGGAFSALANYVLSCGGSVFGAELYFENGKAIIEHRMITKIEELPLILGSKYVQSDITKAYEQVRKELLSGSIVLFSGCSCQVNGLKNFLRETDTTNLYTIDLICHGVPSSEFFNSYIMFLEKKYGGYIKAFTFRTKKNGRIVYEITARISDQYRDKEIQIPISKSGYFLSFMGQQSYRPACYQCPYASLDKPADITIGDYFEAQNDYPELFNGPEAMGDSFGISCVITQSDKGQQLLDKAMEYICIKEVDPHKVQKSHLNLQRPSTASFERKILINGYEKCGYSFIDRYYKLRESIVCIPRKLKKFIKSCLRPTC